MERKEPISPEGLLLVDKPSGITSHDVVNRVRRAANTRRVGHAGTLDPFATGLLLLGIGRATKWLTRLVGLDKTYEATLMLGATTDTYDLTGIVTPTDSAAAIPTLETLERTLRHYTGEQDQRAPLFSAKKLHGKPLYAYARAGVADESMRPTKRITIYTLDLLSYTWPTLRLLVRCSSGTYIRSLAHDIGSTLGTGGYLTELRRTHIGPFSLEESRPLSSLQETDLATLLLSQESLDKRLIA